MPSNNESREYVLVTDDGNRYPPKYVLAVAYSLENNNEEISTNGYNTLEAKKYLENLGFTIKNKNEFKLVITRESVSSTDECFTMDNLKLGDLYKPLDVYFKKATGKLLGDPSKKERKKFLTKHCHVSLAKYLKNRLMLYLLRTRKVFLFVNTPRISI